MNRIGLLLGIFILGAILFACAPKSVSVEKPTSPETIAPEVQSTVKESWQIKWEKTLSEAKKEGKVVVYTSAAGHVGRALSQAFQDKYGIAAEFVSGKGGELTAKVLAEQKAGLYLADTYISGLGTSLFYALKPADAVDTLEKYFIVPDISDPKTWFQGLGWIDDEHTALAIAAYGTLEVSINTDLVKGGEIKAFKDLLNPKWKRKIVMNDPVPTGTGQRFVGFLSENYGIDYLRGLAKQEPMIVRDQRLQVEWLARGKYAIGTSTKPEILLEFASAGAPLKNLLMEGIQKMSAGGGVLAVFKNPPHPNAVKVFVNWILSYDGGLAYSKAMGVQSRRLDVPVDHLDPIGVRQPGKEYFDSNHREFLLKEPEFSKLAQEIFGHLMK